MQYDQDKVDEVALALLYFSLGNDNRAWKGMDWSISDRLYQKGWIESPRNKNLSFELTDEGREACIRFFQKHFAINSQIPENLSSLPISIDSLEILYGRSEEMANMFFLDRATGSIVRLEEADEAISNNPRYIVIPISSAEEREQNSQSSQKNHKRARKIIKEWLKSHTVFHL